MEGGLTDVGSFDDADGVFARRTAACWQTGVLKCGTDVEAHFSVVRVVTFRQVGRVTNVGRATAKFP